jgi:hypothetical protein
MNVPPDEIPFQATAMPRGRWVGAPAAVGESGNARFPSMGTALEPKTRVNSWMPVSLRAGCVRWGPLTFGYLLHLATKPYAPLSRDGVNLGDAH